MSNFFRPFEIFFQKDDKYLIGKIGHIWKEFGKQGVATYYVYDRRGILERRVAVVAGPYKSLETNVIPMKL